MQAGTGAWVYQTWWKSLPDFVEVSVWRLSVTVVMVSWCGGCS